MADRVSMDDQTASEDSISITDQLTKEYDSVFKNKRLIKPNTIVNEDRIVGRDQQLKQVTRMYRPVLDEQPPEDLLLRGPSGTGKTLIAESVTSKLKTLASNRGVNIHISKLNCKQRNTEFDVVCNMVRQIELEEDIEKSPTQGVSLSVKYDRLFQLVDEHIGVLICVFDEIDMLRGQQHSDPDFSSLLYTLSRPNELYPSLDNEISIIATTNSPKSLMDGLNSRTDSTFNPRDVQFGDYDAKQIIEILEHRSDAFEDDALGDSVIDYVSALSAQSEGDARFAIDLLREAGYKANESGDDTVTEDHVDQAQKEVEKNYILELVKSVSNQKMYSALSVALLLEHGSSQLKKHDSFPSGNPSSSLAYDMYEVLCDQIDAECKTPNSFYRWLRELETYETVSLDRYSNGFGSGVQSEVSLPNTTPSMLIDAVVDSSTGKSIEGLEDNQEKFASIVPEVIAQFNAGD